MKQTYVKPRILVERFSLTQSIAVNCGVPSNPGTLGNNLHSDPYSCMWDFGGYTAFIDTPASVCQDATDQVKENEEINGACYNNPTGIISVFGSV